MVPNLQFIVYDRSREAARIAWYGKRLVIGRRIDADIRINEPTMSGLHAEIVPSADGIRLRDLQSLNGTQLNGVRVVESLLRLGDQIQIGRARIVVASPESRTTELALEANPEIGPSGSQTVKIRLDRLREAAHDLEEDRRIMLLRDLFEALSSVEEPEKALANTREVLEQAFSRARAFLITQDENGAWREVSPDPGNRRPSMTFVEETVHSTSAVLSTSLAQDQRFSTAESVRISGIETAMAAPVSCDGRPVAVLYIDRPGLPAFGRQDLNILGIAVNHVSAVLESVSRFAELRRTNLELTHARENLAALNRNLEGLVEERTLEIRRQSDEIKSLALAKDELLGVAAHDIRGPLTVIQGTAELLRLRGGNIEAEMLARSLEMIHGAAKGLSQLLSELLDAKAIESGKITLRRRNFSIDSLLGESLGIARLAAEAKAIALHVETEPGATVFADPQRLGQALTNLVINAVKFSENGSSIALRSRARSDGGTQLEVEDEGIGIPEEELGRLFGSFEQGHAGRVAGGSGLGLMIARRLVELHGGQLTVESQVGLGSRFIMSLPGPGAEPQLP